MPPKKTAAAKPNATTSDDGSKEGGKKGFSWTAENERKLLLCTHPFTTISTAEVEKLLEYFPGTNMNGIKIRYSRLRVERNKFAEEHGFDTTGEAAAKGTSKKAAPKGKKRVAGDGEEATTPAAKKGKKGKKEEVGVKQEEEEDIPTNDLKAGVKNEESDF